MELVLYHPEYGYYSDPEKRKIGRKGDFFTSVSVGETFGFLLAERIRGEWGKWGGGGPIVIVEQGAHDGQLARDIVTAMRVAETACDYRIFEPRGRIRENLGTRIRESGFEEITLIASIQEATAPVGVFLCNELLDAFPFRRLVFDGGSWKELRVAGIGGGFGWTTGELDAELAGYADDLGSDFPAGYETEVCPAVGGWVEKIAELFDRGIWWVIDYGYEAADYFSPARKQGTYRCYRKHTANENPFAAPGETDITAHVNFTHLQELAGSSGLESRPLTDQHHFLTEAARPWLESLEGTPPDGETRKRLRQFQTLTHPGLMGQQFKVAEFTRSIP